LLDINGIIVIIYKYKGEILMTNIKLQDLTAIIHHSSRFNGNQFDMVHVETILQTDIPLALNASWYIPCGTTVPDYLAQMLQVSNVAMYPMSAEYVDKEVSNIIEASKGRNLNEVTHDSSLLMLQAIMTPQSFTPISGATNLYHLAYDYKLFANRENPKTYDFKVVLPFHGLGMPTGSRVQMAIILPISATLDATTTKGIAINGQVIEELTQDIPNCQRKIVSFAYQNDPEFTIRYVYP
jgi:hypothetical protein